ncbi:MAG TPA: DUF481 domain-containing protein [Bryobacteraceae bacterium]|nr:DUF481 domain-containing protein [Bryobacteraceae bacterium]
MVLRSRSYLFGLAALLPLLLFADEVSLQNGDRISGTIVKKDGDTLTLKSEFLGTLNIPWKAVTGVVSSEPVVVMFPGGRVARGNVNIDQGQVEVTTPEGIEMGTLEDLTALRSVDEERKYEGLLHPGLWELWTGTLDLSLAGARGNSRTSTVTTAIQASRTTQNDKFTLKVNQIYSAGTIHEQTASTAQSFHGGWTYDHHTSRRFFVSGFNDYEHDEFQDLDLRFTLGSSFGWNAAASERSKLEILGGADYSRTHFSTEDTRNEAEATFGDNWSYRVSGASEFTQSFRVFPNLTNPGEYRLNFDLGATNRLNKWLAWQVAASDRFLSDPVAGRKRNDILLTTGFRLSMLP